TALLRGPVWPGQSGHDPAASVVSFAQAPICSHHLSNLYTCCHVVVLSRDSNSPLSPRPHRLVTAGLLESLDPVVVKTLYPRDVQTKHSTRQGEQRKQANEALRRDDNPTLLYHNPAPLLLTLFVALLLRQASLKEPPAVPV
ncbi:unnamed protein product, partial [Protopolystoma xenopodis]